MGGTNWWCLCCSSYSKTMRCDFKDLLDVAAEGTKDDIRHGFERLSGPGCISCQLPNRRASHEDRSIRNWRGALVLADPTSFKFGHSDRSLPGVICSGETIEAGCGTGAERDLRTELVEV